MAEVTELTMVGGSVVLNVEPTVDAESLRRWLDKALWDDLPVVEWETTLFRRVHKLYLDLGGSA